MARKRSGLFGSWKNLGLLTKISRSHLSVTHQRRGTVLRTTFTDNTSGVALEVETPPVGNLGIGEFLKALDGTS
ncbi:hypothetical protein O4214_05800 [Rhodococcus erythropolis]|uniref:hypothetical protein n=1 Tax=Rhodococcus erythropolis TaxID=1833 RepID=UPI001E4B557E|nr:MULTISPECIES: hypothetical protein [Rhodococcus erythropolis group]MCD2104433.1 hypothetical protein [Rhodococcus qingshengii]MCZ4523487.1 hypothetical protein [Rhodococcus erythropolis]